MRQEIEALIEASKFLDKKQRELAGEPLPIYRIILHALQHVDLLLTKELKDAA